MSLQRIASLCGLILAFGFAIPIVQATDPAQPSNESNAIRFETVGVMPVTPNANLMTNGSFEQVDDNGMPVGWSWDPGNTDAKCALVRSDSHMGQHCICITNGTSFNLTMHGTFSNSVPVKLNPGETYTLSACVKSRSSGMFTIYAGADWQMRLSIPNTEGQWRRIWKTIVPETRDCDFRLFINTESPTPGVWIDDIKLEKGSVPTFDTLDADNRAAALLFLDDSKCDFVDEPQRRVLQLNSDVLDVSYLLSAPRPTVVTLTEDGKIVQSLDVAAGTWNLAVKGKCPLKREDPRKITLQVNCDGKEAARLDTWLQFYSADIAMQKLAALKAQLLSFQKSMADLQQRGQDVSYPQVSYTTLENSIGLATVDVQHNEINRAYEQIDDMQRIAARLKQKLDDAVAGKTDFPFVPRWVGNERPTIEHGSYIGPVRTADGKTVKRPIFFAGYGAFDQVINDMEKWPKLGINIIQIQYGPGHLLPKEGVTDETCIQTIRSALDRAQKSGVAIDLLLSPHFFPEWAMAKWPHLRKHRQGFLQYCLHAPEGNELLRQFITTLVTPIANHPALQSICLSNEPDNMEEPCESARSEWRAWLQERHKTIQQLNACYGSAYASFDAVPLPNPLSPQPATPLWMDFVRFNQEFFAQWHQVLADAVRKVAPALPIHAKPTAYSIIDQSIVSHGIDATLFSRFSNINGCDSDFLYDNGTNDSGIVFGWTLCSLCYDLLRSVYDAPIFNSEDHLIKDRETRRIPANQMRTALWQQAVHGQNAAVIWVWQPTFDPMSDLAGNIMYRPACTEAVGIVNCDLNRLAPEITVLQQAKPDVLILQSFTASVWDRDRYDHCLRQLYTALSFTGLKIGLVSERQLESGVVPEGQVVFVPNVTHLSDAAADALRKYQGRLVFIGPKDVLAYNEYGQDRKECLHGEPIGLDEGIADTTENWCTLLRARLSGWNIRPAIDLLDQNKQPVWGVEWRCVDTPKGTMINLCNYREEPVTFSMIHAGNTASGQDLVTGQPIVDTIQLQPLDVRLILVNPQSTSINDRSQNPTISESQTLQMPRVAKRSVFP